ncbi:MAG: hypothetical protein J6386_20875 [Candidatus Synoicihabitans palmerolidicus]|nr:hypothetical protein [Candidatus Synoicihabitans palmerolidicus]
MLAFYHAWQRRSDIVYSSQIGDGHICIPLCLGLFAVLRPVPLPPFFQPALRILGGAVLVHAICLFTVGQLPRPIAALLVASYAGFLDAGLMT